MRSKFSIALSALVLSGALAIAGGCGNADELEHSSKNKAGIKVDRSEGRIQAHQLARIVEQVPGVERADVAMNGEDVLVGIEVDNPGKESIVEKQVVSALLWQYSEYHYHVTSNETLREKIKTVGAKKAGGYQAQMFNQDIKALANAIDHAATHRP